MCGRFNFTAEDVYEFWSVARDIVAEMERKDRAIKEGEVYPTDLSPVMTANGPAVMCWGFPGFKGNNVIINAKSETISEKPMFRDSVASRRCVIVSTGFYEWGVAESDQQSLFETAPKAKNGKTKYLFQVPGQKVLCMAGVYKQFGDDPEPRYVIMTTEANQSIKDVHNRMPVVLQPDEVEAWLKDGEAPEKYVDRSHIVMNKRTA